MSLELTRENMLLFFPSLEKPLSDKEINDFLNTPYQEEPRLWWPEWIKDLPKKSVNNIATKKYTTKKEIKQEIKNIDNSYDWWLSHKQAAKTEMDIAYSEIHLEDLIQKKEELQSRLRYTGVKFENNDLERAKQVPISNFLNFNSAGFTKCLWHSERTASLHKITGKNKIYCFGCAKTADVVDVVMELNNCTLPEALKIILK